MVHHGHRDPDSYHHQRHDQAWKLPRAWRRWHRLYWLLSGILALAWLALRSGSKPSRLAYPCQQAALSAASLVFGATLVGAVVALRRRLTARWLTPLGIVLGAVGLVAAVGAWSYVQRTVAWYEGPAGYVDPAPPTHLGRPVLDGPPRQLARTNPRVVIAHHPEAHDGSSGRDNVHLVDDAVRMMVDEAVIAYTDTGSVAAAWEQIIPDPSRKVAIKINCQITGIFTKAKVVMPIAEGLIARGVPADNIIIYDRRDTAFSYAGFVRNPNGPGIRVGALERGDFGAYSSHGEMYNIAKLLVDESGDFDCDYLINVPVCKALDGYSGVTLALKNHYGTCEPRHTDIHNEICRTNDLQPIRDKTRLVVLDATYCEYKWFNGRDQTWVDVVNKIIVSDDPVAVDYHGWQLIEGLRSDHDMGPCNPYPHHIDYAADVYALGTNDPAQMEIVELELPLENIELSVARGPGPTEVTLSWHGGQPGFSIHRSDDPSEMITLGNYLGRTNDRSWIDDPPQNGLHFYIVSGS